MSDRAVITGAAAVTALGVGLDELWEAVLEGRTGVGPVVGFDASSFPCASAAQALGLTGCEPRLSVREESLMGKPGGMLLLTARAALADSGLAPSPEQRGDMGFFAAMGTIDPAPGDLDAAARSACSGGGLDGHRFFCDGYRMIHPLWPLAMLNNVGFCIVSTAIGVLGENAVFSPGADGGLAALAEAAWQAVEGRASAALAAGVSPSISPMSLARAHLEPANDRGAAPRSPGEGCAVVVVEVEAAALSRGGRPRAVVAGWSSRCDSGERGCEEAMREAVAASRLEPSDVDLVLLHGDPSAQRDGDERSAVRRVFGAEGGAAAAVSSKPAIGHLGAGAGTVDVCLALKILETGSVPAGLVGVGGQCTTRSVESCRPPRAVLVNALGTSGQCASVVLTKAAG